MVPGAVMVDASVKCVGLPEHTVSDVKSGSISIRLNVTVSLLVMPLGNWPTAIIVCGPLKLSGYDTNVCQLDALSILAFTGDPVKLP